MKPNRPAHRTAILATTAFLFCFSSQAIAQSNTADDEIIVTARKKTETIQEVPLSVTALSGVAIEQSGVETLEDVANFTPGLTFQEFNGGGLGAPVIRGLAQTDIASFNNNVGVYLDGVFLSGKANLDIGLFDLERVEVTRGPQSALYGNNSFSGAINYVTKKPGDEFGGTIEATVGSDDRYDISGSISGPISESLSGRLNASYGSFDGTIENDLDNENLGGYDEKIAVSGAVDFNPTDQFSATLFGYYGKEELDGSAGFIEQNNCGGPNSLAGTNLDFLNGRGGTNDRFFCGEFNVPDSVAVDPRAFSDRESFLTYLKLNYDFGPFTLASVTSYGDYTADALSDQELDRTTLDDTRRGIIPFIGDANDFSQELRLESYGKGAFDWAVGAYYISREADEFFQTGPISVLVDPSTGVLDLDRFQTFESDAISVFGLVDYNLTDRFSLAGEARYTSDDQSQDSALSFPAFFVPVTESSASETFNFFTYRATAAYDLTDRANVYASVAKGVKTGGFNVTSDETESTFDEETNITYEVGYKTNILDGRLAFNAAAFYVDLQDLQLPAPSSVAGNANVTTNIGDADALGAEFDLTFRASENTTLTVGYAYSDVTFDGGLEDVTASSRCATAADCFGEEGPNGGVLIGGNRLPRSAEHQFSGSLVQYFPVSFGNIYLRGDLSAQSERFSTPLNLQDDGGRTLVNARIGAEIGDSIDFSVWSQNLTDENYVNSSINEPEFFPISTFSTAFVANTRTFGATLKYTY